jgi:hypothetical protein
VRAAFGRSALRIKKVGPKKYLTSARRGETAVGIGFFSPVFFLPPSGQVILFGEGVVSSAKTNRNSIREPEPRKKREFPSRDKKIQRLLKKELCKLNVESVFSFFR